MKKMILLGMTVIVGASAPLVTYAQAKKSSQLTEIIESTNKNHVRMRYFRDKTTHVVLTRSDADILSDGDISKVPRANRINDQHRQNQLFSDLKLNPYAVNYTVIPDELRHRETLKANGVRMRSLYYVVNIKNGKSSFGLVADIGPGGQVTNGEFSVHQIKELGLPVDKVTATGGTDANDIVTIIFPHSEDLIAKNDLQRLIDERLQGALQVRVNSEGQKLLKKYSDQAKTKNLEKIIEAIKSETSSVKKFD